MAGPHKQVPGAILPQIGEKLCGSAPHGSLQLLGTVHKGCMQASAYAEQKLCRMQDTYQDTRAAGASGPGLALTARSW